MEQSKSSMTNSVPAIPELSRMPTKATSLEPRRASANELKKGLGKCCRLAGDAQGSEKLTCR